ERGHRRALVLGGFTESGARAGLRAAGSSGDAPGHGAGSALANAGEAVARNEGTSGEPPPRLRRSPRRSTVVGVPLTRGTESIPVESTLAGPATHAARTGHVGARWHHRCSLDASHRPPSGSEGRRPCRLSSSSHPAAW